MNVNREMSLSIAKLVRARNGQCYSNCAHALLHIPDGVYVEGFATDTRTNEVLAHAWIEWNGDIIEPTPVWRKMKDVRYFAVAKFPFFTLGAILIKYKDSYEFPLREFLQRP